MKIAVVGAGISGLGAALGLAADHDVRLFEQAERPGGHANTVDVRFGDAVQPVDTGFIVYNERNYPNLLALFAELGVPTKWSDMSFGFSLNHGELEYACDNLDKIFAQRWRAFDPRFVGVVREILRFCRHAPGALTRGRLDGLSLGDWLDHERYSHRFRERFLLPMGGAIWSTRLDRMLAFPAAHFIRFFCNHDLTTGLDPAQRWRTVDGGSRDYVRRVLGRLGPRVQLGRQVVAVDCGGGQGRPLVRFADGGGQCFDQVVLAVHGPNALRLNRGADDETQALLAAFRTSANRAVLHSDPRLMPRRRKVWSSWNFLSNGMEQDSRRPAQVTYWMNRLQGIPADRPLFVSLNPVGEPDPALTHAAFDYAHPLYDSGTFEAQRAFDRVQGRGGVWYAGAWLGYGFHEDGLKAGLRVAEALGSRPPWVRDTGQPIGGALAHAAE